MADFDLSLAATMDASGVAAGAEQSEQAIDKVTAAERRANVETNKSKAATDAAARAERERKAAIDQVRSAIDPAYASQKRMNEILAQARALYKSGAISLQELTQAERLHAQALKAGAQSAGQLRAGYQQLGFQIGDVTQSLALGVNPLVVFGQQAGQTAGALALMGGRLGAVGRALSGPFGAAVLGAVTILGFLAMSANDVDEALEDASDSADSFGNAQSLLGRVINLTTGDLENQNVVLRETIRLMAQRNVLAAQQAERDAIDALGTGDSLQGVAALRAVPPSVGDAMDPIAQLRARREAEAARAGAAPLGDAIDAFAAGEASFEDTIKLIDEIGETARGSSEDLLDLKQRVIDVGIARNDQEANQAVLDFLNGGELDPRLRRPGRTSRSSSDKSAAAEAQRLADFGERAAEQIQRINERFDEQPRFIDQARQSARELDSIIAELSERKPPGFEDMIATARDAKAVIADALIRPFEELRTSSQQRQQIEELIAAGREDEAEALRIIHRLEKDLGPIERERREEILRIVEAESELTEELERRQEITNAYLEASKSARQEVEAILSGTGKLSNLKNVFRNLQGRVLAEQLFGDVFRDLDEFVREETAIKSSVDIMATETERAGQSAGDFADELLRQTSRLRSAGSSSGAPGDASFDQFLAQFDAAIGQGADNRIEGDRLIVEAVRGGVNGLSPERYFDELTKTLVRPLLDGFDDIFDTTFFAGLEGVLSGALNGALTAGPVGALLGGLKGIEGLPQGISDALGVGLRGAQTGTLVAGLGDAFGINLSNSGAQIGGAIGSFLPIPGGDLIGAIAGGIIGKLFGSTKYGTASLSGGDALSISSKGKGRYEGASTLGGSVQEALANIADELGGDLGSFLVSIGTFKDDYRVSTTGRTGKLKDKFGDVTDFGSDQAAAIAFAIADAIGDGAINGVSAAVSKALRSSSDVEEAINEALAVQELEQAIEDLGNPVRAFFRDFEDVAEERLRLAREYGVDLLKVEELNAKERAELVDQALESSIGSLQRLLDDLDFGSLFEGSAADRRQAILGEIADAEQDVSLGVEGATDRLADLQRQLIETSRSAFGTAGGEYATDLADVRSSAEAIIAAERARIEAAAAQTQEQIDLANEANDHLAGINGRLDTLIQSGGYAAVNPGSLPYTDYSQYYLANVRFPVVNY